MLISRYKQPCKTCSVDLPGFLRACNLWQKRTANDDTLDDIYDGRIWTGYDGAHFDSVPGHLLLTLNVDWFQPFKHTKDYVGDMYIAVQNLQRECRYRVENIIIPSPKEPQGTVDSFLGPLVKELQLFWQGLYLLVHTGNRALVCCSTDLYHVIYLQPERYADSSVMRRD